MEASNAPNLFAGKGKLLRYTSTLFVRLKVNFILTLWLTAARYIQLYVFLTIHMCMYVLCACCHCVCVHVSVCFVSVCAYVCTV